MTKISRELLQQLRDRTGAGLMDCKKALEEAGGDIEKAVESLRKKGAKIAEKRAEKSAQEGIVHAYIHAGNKLGVLVEINCETDFVARTDDLKQFAHNLCLHIAAMSPQYVSEADIPADIVEKEKAIYREQVIQEGKPEQVADKIVQGKWQKRLEDLCLLNQPYIKDENTTIADVINDLTAKLGEKIVVNQFARYQIGS